MTLEFGIGVDIEAELGDLAPFVALSRDDLAAGR